MQSPAAEAARAPEGPAAAETVPTPTNPSATADSQQQQQQQQQQDEVQQRALSLLRRDLDAAFGRRSCSKPSSSAAERLPTPAAGAAAADGFRFAISRRFLDNRGDRMLLLGTANFLSTLGR